MSIRRASRTTAQTFQMASYLKSHGADLTLVRYLLSSDLNSYLQMSELVARSEYITKNIVVAAASEMKFMIMSQLLRQQTLYCL